MNDEARRKARTQGRYSLEKKPLRKSIGASPNSTEMSSKVSLEHSVNAELVKFAEEIGSATTPKGLQPQNAAIIEPACNRLSYESTKSGLEKLHPVCKVLKGEDFRKWIKLDPTAEKPSFIYYDPNFLSDHEAAFYFNDLKNNKHFQWEQKTMRRDGTAIPVPRLTYWYGPLDYSYGSGIVHKAKSEWASEVEEIRSKIVKYLSKSAQCNTTFNSVLLNYYRDCKDGVAWHSDDEVSMGVQPTIASVSLGETRKFELKRNDASEPEWRVFLATGSLLVMSGNTQLDWKHRIPTEYHDKGPRINLTYRNIQPV